MEEVKVGDLTIKPSLNREVKEIHPAVGVIDDTAYVGEWVPCEIAGKDGKAAFKDLLFLVTDKREIILANDEVLRQRGWRIAYKPIRFQNRWTLKHVQNYLHGAVVDPNDVFTHVMDIWKEYMEFPNESEYVYHVLWDIDTHLHHLFNAFPYLYIGSIKRCGKTKDLTIHSCLAFNAFFSNNMSTSAIYRLIQNARGTLLIDETEKLSRTSDRMSERTLEFRSILLSGYKKGGKAFRVEKTRKEMLQPEEFEVYSPKALANILGLEDVLEDRCHAVILRRSRNKQIVNREPDINDPRWVELRNEFYLFYLMFWREIKVIYDEICEGSVGCEAVKDFRNTVSKFEDGDLLVSRELELWNPIFALAIFLDRKRVLRGTYTASQPTLLSQMVAFAIEHAKWRYMEEMTTTGEIALMESLLKIVEKDGYYKVKDVKEDVVARFEEEQKWLTSEWVGRALKRLGFQQKRRVGTGVEYFFSTKDIHDLAEKMAVSKPTLTLQEKLELILNKVVELQGERGASKIEVADQLTDQISREETLQLIDKLVTEGTIFKVDAEHVKKT